MVELALGGVDNFIFVQMQLDTESELNCGGGCSKKVFKGEEIPPPPRVQTIKPFQND